MTNFKKVKESIINNSLNSSLGKDNVYLHELAVEEFAKELEEDEQIMFCSSGSIEGRNRNGMVFVTNKRVVVSLKVFRTHIEQFHYESITGVDFRMNWLGQGIIEIDSYGESKKVDFYDAGKDADYVRKAVQYIKKQMIEAKQPTLHQVKHEDDFITQLERLAKLKEQGILTEEEFQKQKEKMLNG